MNWKRVISGVLAAAMLSALPVQLLASAEGAEAAAEVNTWEDLTSMESLEDSNTFYYNKNGYTFEKLSHPEKDVKVADGIVDYRGDGAVDVVTDPEAEGYNAGDRGQNYAWAAVGYGDWIYVGTCYAAIGNTLSLMKSSLGDEFDDKVLKATFDALYNGTFFLEEADGGKPKGVLTKINTKTGETKVLMSGTLNGQTPLFRNAIEYKGKLYFCGQRGHQHLRDAQLQAEQRKGLCRSLQAGHQHRHPWHVRLQRPAGHQQRDHGRCHRQEQCHLADLLRPGKGLYPDRRFRQPVQLPGLPLF